MQNSLSQTTHDPLAAEMDLTLFITIQPNAKDEGWRLVCISLIRRSPKGTLCRWLRRLFPLPAKSA